MKKFLKICLCLFLSFSLLSASLGVYCYSFIATNVFTEILPVKAAASYKNDRREVAIGGELIGIKMETVGITVVGTDKFETDSGLVSPAEQAGICKGDIIVEANGIKINSTAQFTAIVNENNGNSINLIVERDGERFTVSVFPQKAKSTNLYKSGMWIRDSVGGIGTLTYCDIQNGTLAALGHGIYDSDTGKLITASDGEILSAQIKSVEKGTYGKAGQINGVMGTVCYGKLDKDTEKGIYGTASSVYSTDIYEVAYPEEVHEGEAQIYCTVTGTEKKCYDISIEKVSRNGSNDRDMVLKITDNELLSITGGIVQGMSGSPIIQNGRLVGAVTHVFLNDPTRGYGIFAQTMLEQSDLTAQSINKAA